MAGTVVLILLALALSIPSAAAPITYQVNRQSDDGRMGLTGSLTLEHFDADPDCSHSSGCILLRGGTLDWALQMRWLGVEVAVLDPGNSTLSFDALVVTPTALTFPFPFTHPWTHFFLHSATASWAMYPTTFLGEPGTEILRAGEFVGTIDPGLYGHGPFAIVNPEPGTAGLVLAGLLVFALRH